MKTIKIKELYDEHDCDTCGSSWAEGAEVDIAGENSFLLEPHAHCYDEETYSERTIFERILLELGYKVEYV